jgi:hypothetical protein
MKSKEIEIKRQALLGGEVLTTRTRACYYAEGFYCISNIKADCYNLSNAWKTFFNMKDALKELL